MVSVTWWLFRAFFILTDSYFQRFPATVQPSIERSGTVTEPASPCISHTTAYTAGFPWRPGTPVTMDYNKECAVKCLHGIYTRHNFQKMIFCKYFVSIWEEKHFTNINLLPELCLLILSTPGHVLQINYQLLCFLTLVTDFTWHFLLLTRSAITRLEFLCCSVTIKSAKFGCRVVAIPASGSLAPATAHTTGLPWLPRSPVTIDYIVRQPSK